MWSFFLYHLMDSLNKHFISQQTLLFHRIEVLSVSLIHTVFDEPSVAVPRHFWFQRELTQKECGVHKILRMRSKIRMVTAPGIVSMRI